MTEKPGAAQIEGHEFFDPQMPEVPDEILGVPTEPLINFSHALGGIAILADNLPYAVSGPLLKASMDSKRALALFPLIERVKAGEDLSPVDVRPYRKPIKQLVPKVATADRWARFAVIAGGTGIPLRRALNRKVEEEFVKKAPDLLDEALSDAQAYLPAVEPYVELIERFDNPREQFISEVSIVAQGVRTASRRNAKRRGRNNFVTAQDAAVGIRQTIEEILQDKEVKKTQLPLFSYLVLDKLPADVTLPSSDLLSVAAPEIIDMLEGVLPEDQRDDSFAYDVRHHANPKRSLAGLVTNKLHTLQRVSDSLLPSIRDLLPTSGKEARRTYMRIEEFLRLPERKPRFLATQDEVTDTRPDARRP